MKLFLQILGIFITTGGILFFAIFSCLPFVDSSKDYLINWILCGYFIFWIFIMRIMIIKMFFQVNRKKLNKTEL